MARLLHREVSKTIKTKPAEKAWAALNRGLEEAHDEDDPVGHARHVVRGWINYFRKENDQKGKQTETTDDTRSMTRKIQQLLNQNGFGEAMSGGAIRTWAGEGIPNGIPERDRTRRVVHPEGERLLAGGNDSKTRAEPTAAPPARTLAVALPPPVDNSAGPASTPSSTTNPRPMPESGRPHPHRRGVPRPRREPRPATRFRKPAARRRVRAARCDKAGRAGRARPPPRLGRRPAN